MQMRIQTLTMSEARSKIAAIDALDDGHHSLQFEFA